MKRDGEGMGYSAMKKDHWEKESECGDLSDTKYSRGQFSNPEELKESVDKLSSYVKSHRMKY